MNINKKDIQIARKLYNTLYFGNYKITYEIHNNHIILICQDNSNKILGIVKTSLTIENLVRWINWRIAQNISLKYIADLSFQMDFSRIIEKSICTGITRNYEDPDTLYQPNIFIAVPEIINWQQAYYPKSEPQKPTIEFVD